MEAVAHNIQVNTAMREVSKVSLGDTAEFSICSATDTVKVRVPSWLSAVLKESAKAEPPVES